MSWLDESAYGPLMCKHSHMPEMCGDARFFSPLNGLGLDRSLCLDQQLLFYYKSASRTTAMGGRRYARTLHGDVKCVRLEV